ncbi:MAG: hypothetical protein GY816_01245 [Cytophagales bacterium]|nr:hypothetical protein [Cytophagales bacterium]
METEQKRIRVIKKDLAVLAPGTSLTIRFFPKGGSIRVDAHSDNPPGDVITNTPLVVETELPTMLTATDLAVSSRESSRPNAIRNVVSSFARNATSAGNTASYGNSSTPAVVARMISPVDRIRTPGVFLPTPPIPPHPTMLVTLSRSSKSQPIKSEELFGGGFPSPELPDSNPTPVGFAPEQWTVNFKNITNKPIRCFGQVTFTESRTLRATLIPKAFLSRMLRQTMDGLGLTIEFSRDKVTLDFSHEIKSLLKTLKPISIDYPYDFKLKSNTNAKSKPLTISLEERTVDDNPELWPALKIQLLFDTKELVFERDEWIDAEVTIENLCIDAHMALSSVDSNYIAILKAGNNVQGDFPVVPTILVETTFESNKDISITDSNIPGAQGIGNLLINLFLDVEKELTDAFESFQDDVSRYIQLGVHMIADKEHDFCGLGLSGDDWRVLTGPIFLEQPKQNPTVSPLLADKTPIDGPQPDIELEQLNRINHIVVLMMENRSYDHVLGYLSHPDYGNNPDYEGLTGEEENIISGLDPATPFPMQTTRFFPSPPHGFASVQLQVKNGDMSGFGSEFRNSYSTSSVDARSIMNFHVPGQLQIYDDLVANYTVACHWYASLPGPTFPNRLCTITGKTPILENDEIPRDNIGYLEIPTIFDLLTENNVSWRYYEHDLTMLRMMKNFRLENDKIRHFDLFEDDVKSEGLQSVTFIDPNFVDVPGGDGPANDDHPGGSDMEDGQNLIANIIAKLKASSQWDNTMLVITYDEHGGFFDHVPPPGSAKSQFKGPGVIPKIHPDAPEMLGVRVPAFIVSPRAEPGEVIDRVFDHTSILKTILARFLPGQEHLLGHRVEKAAHLGGAVPRPIPRRVVVSTTDEELTVFAARSSEQPRATEEIEPGSFHDVMKSFNNPLGLSREKIESMIGRLS